MSALKTLHKLASPMLYQTRLYQKLWRKQNRKAPFSFVVVYHRVVADNAEQVDQFNIERGISATAFERQMRFLVQHFKPVKASQVQSEIGGEIKFAVTLDDGYIDNYEIAAPILKKLGIPATFFVVSEFVGSNRLFWWEQIAELMRDTGLPELDLRAALPGLVTPSEQVDVLPLRNAVERGFAYEQLCTLVRQGRHLDIPIHMQGIAGYFEMSLREQGRRYGLMDWKQLKELSRQGFEIGGHTATHCNLVGAADELLEKELVDSMSTIEAELELPVESFAYPYGLFEAASERICGLLARTNCKAAFTTEQGVVDPQQSVTELPRTKLNRPYHFACAFNLQDTLNRSEHKNGACVT